MLIKKKKVSEGGFSLIELAIGVVIIGVLLAGALQSYRIWREQQQTKTTAEHVNKVSYAIQAFIAANGYFPCPASLTAPRNNDAYGTETDCSDVTQAPVGPGLSADGVGAGLSGRFVTADGDADPLTPDTTFNPRVRIGGVPFRTLNIPERLQYDAYGSRIVYAVTEFLANSNGRIQPGVGGINVVDRNANPVLDIPDSVNFIVVAPGRNLLGGYNMQGAQGTACAGATVDVENCTIDATFVVDQKVDLVGANYFDDVVTYNTPIDFPRWIRSRTNPIDIHTLEPDAVVGGDFIFGQRATLSAANPNMIDDGAKLWVRGSVRVDGDLKTDNVCNENNEDCFNPSVIAGAGVNCAPGSGLMRGVSTEEFPRGPNPTDPPGEWRTDALCSNTFSRSCPTGQHMTGISSGSPQCACIYPGTCGGGSTTTTGTTTTTTSTGITTTSSYGPSSSGVPIGP